MGLATLVILFSLLLRDSSCYSKTERRYATNETQTLSHIDYANDEDYTFIIEPAMHLNASLHYLEIIWTLFDVEGSIPYCSNDYVEVFLTRANLSIGYYCSDNLVGGKPFNMYSHDGYIMLHFISDPYVTRKGFSLNFQLKSREKSPLGGSVSPRCYSNDNGGSTGNFYSLGWPYGFYGSNISQPCWTKNYIGNKKMRIATMDVNLQTTWPDPYACKESDTFFEIKDSKRNLTDLQSIIQNATNVFQRICGTTNAIFHVSRKPFVYMYFNRTQTSYKYRGVVIGYLVYGDPPSLSQSSMSSVITPTATKWSRWSHWQKWSKWSHWEKWSKEELKKKKIRERNIAIGSAVGALVAFIGSIIAGIYKGYCKCESCQKFVSWLPVPHTRFRNSQEE
ncbi:uncharacterized protein LOC135683609 [Rhopilema esculentum]|uniref:uncharacterized protein LOC135683609 n=1 Tax=Rhopilema esculentum TaxID=499914 RepID=UPI0031E2CF02